LDSIYELGNLPYPVTYSSKLKKKWGKKSKIFGVKLRKFTVSTRSVLIRPELSCIFPGQLDTHLSSPFQVARVQSKFDYQTLTPPHVSKMSKEKILM